MKNKSLVCRSLLSILFFPTASAFAFFCPTNFNSVLPGDSLSAVQQACGAPTSQRTYAAQENTAQEWSYFIPGKGQDVTKLAFLIKDNKVLNITVTSADSTCQMNLQNNTSINMCPEGSQIEKNVSYTDLCGPTVINLGSSVNQVQTACGNAAFVKTYAQPSQTPGKQITEYYYDSNPPVTFLFEDGRLTDRK